MKRIVFSLFLALILAIPSLALAIDYELGGEIRVRYENDNMNSNNLGAKGWDKDINAGEEFWTQRARLNAKFSLDANTTAFFSLHAVRAWGEDQGPKANPDNNDVGLNQGWLEMKNLAGPAGIKVGRQILSYGKQRILGALEWADTGNRWDATKIFYESDILDADLFFATLANEDTDHTQDNNLNGLYVTLKSIPATKLDLYVIQKDMVGGMNFMTYGLRVAGKAVGIDWDVEYSAQGGDAATDITQSASAWAAEAGYTISGVGEGLRLGIQGWSATGDDDPADDKNESFDNLYPTNHPLYGISDVAGTNLSDRSGQGLSVMFMPIKGMKIKAEYLTISAQASGDKVGDEANIQFWHSLTPNVKWYTYVAQFTPDEEYVGAGNNNDAYQLVGTQLHAKF